MIQVVTNSIAHVSTRYVMLDNLLDKFSFYVYISDLLKMWKNSNLVIRSVFHTNWVCERSVFYSKICL